MNDLPVYLKNSGAVEIKKQLGKIAGGEVLDVATSEGGFIRTLMEALKGFESFTGIDISKKHLRVARKQHKDKPVDFLKMNAEELQFNDNYFDTVSISHSLHHLDDIAKVLAEMKRVLKPSGNFILQEMYNNGDQTAAQQNDILAHHWGAEIDSVLGIPHNKTMKKELLKDIVSRIGFRDLKVLKSTRYVKCLFCEEKFECEDPKYEEIIKVTIKDIENDLNRIKDHSEHNKMLKEAEKIIESLQKYGTAPASFLFFIGKK